MRDKKVSLNFSLSNSLQSQLNVNELAGKNVMVLIEGSKHLIQ